MNWAGYVLTGGSYREVGAEWTVPTLDCSASPDGSTADWVGIDGWVHPAALFQAGTASTCSGGSQTNTVVWSDSAQGFAGQEQFDVNAGDVIEARVARTAAGTWAATVTDETTGQSAHASEPVAYPAASAEWIAEDPGLPGSSSLAPLADFGSVAFTGLSVSPAGLPSYADAIEMLRPDGSTAALPGPVQGTPPAASFTITYGSRG
ncbi:MAG: G1 family glutamic endopeptidase [Acidimicrobiales bacterium]